jgi:hypothetical protein
MAAGGGGSDIAEAEHVLGPPIEYLLRPGDVLYVPRGSPHEAFTPPAGDDDSNAAAGAGADTGADTGADATGSLHLTLGLVTESDARYWMLRNQLLALCKQRRQKGISCAGDVGETQKTQNGSPDFRSVCPELVLANRRRFSDTANCIIIAPKRLKLRLSGSARKSQKRFRDTPMFKFQAVLART